MDEYSRLKKDNYTDIILTYFSTDFYREFWKESYIMVTYKMLNC